MMRIWWKIINAILCWFGGNTNNDTYVANPYQWSSLIRILVMPTCIISEYIRQNMYPLRYESVHSVTEL